MAAAADSDPAVTTSTCAHCQREIPSSNIALHSVHCARNLQKCEHCKDMVPLKHTVLGTFRSVSTAKIWSH
ncbi:unnamed protein product [Urochloa humidicola]